ncbi:hypothetical protein QLX08_005607 [Tetragonisca angustula]|uniref:Uncharacterized protein n=1 Tax=Tetragonisca angustula TaxID=166442 RepID=A0AAW0ZXL6_9HYME
MELEGEEVDVADSHCALRCSFPLDPVTSVCTTQLHSLLRTKRNARLSTAEKRADNWRIRIAMQIIPREYSKVPRLLSIKRPAKRRARNSSRRREIFDEIW